MLNDIPEDNPGRAKRLNITERDLFERDLKNLLNNLEHLCQGKAEHVDYVKAYKYFVDSWSPDADMLKRVVGSVGYKFGKSDGS